MLFFFVLIIISSNNNNSCWAVIYYLMLFCYTSFLIYFITYSTIISLSLHHYIIDFDDDGGNEKWGMTPTIVMANCYTGSISSRRSCGRPAGNDHSRKPLLPIFKHLEEVSIEELHG